MSLGFPNANNGFEHHDLNEESFWPSFTDIMMVIVMVFLLVAVSVILNNYQLVENLKKSIQAQQLASSIAEDTQLKNSTLEEQLLQLKQQLALANKQINDSKKINKTTQAELLKSQQIIEELNAISKQQTQQLDEKTTYFATLEKESKQKIKQKNEEIVTLQQQQEQHQNKVEDLEAQIEVLRNSLTENSSEYRTLQQTLSDKSSKIEQLQRSLKKQRENSETQLLSLQGELDSLDKKYQKLLRPARSAKDKFVVAIIYTKHKGHPVYRLRTHPKGEYKNVSRRQLERKMAKLKKQHKNNLYVKVVIPKNSGLSYNEALKFTSFMQKSYDYYFQPEETEESEKKPEKSKE